MLNFRRKPRSLRPKAWFITRFLRYTIMRPAAKLKLFTTHTVSGKQHLRKRGGMIVACNHPSSWDALALAAALDRNVTFLAKAELWRWRNPLLRFFLNLMGQIPVDRGNRTSGGKAQATALKVLTHRRKGQDKGGQVVIFPEGGCTPSDGPNAGIMRDFKKGVWFLALESGVPVIPGGIRGTRGIKPLPWNVFRSKHRARVSLKFGEPMYASAYKGRPNPEDEFLTELRWRIEALRT